MSYESIYIFFQSCKGLFETPCILRMGDDWNKLWVVSVLVVIDIRGCYRSVCCKLSSCKQYFTTISNTFLSFDTTMGSKRIKSFESSRRFPCRDSNVFPSEYGAKILSSPHPPSLIHCREET
jgi:hypothetical protein